MKRNRTAKRFFLGGLILSGLSCSLIAVPVTWDGAADTDFANAGNWGGTAPTNDLTTDIATFGGTVTANQPDLSSGNRSVGGLDFQGGGWTLVGSSTLSVGGITSTGNNAISATLVGAGGSTISSATGGTLNLGVITGNTVTFGSAGNLGTVDLAGTSDNASFSPVVAFGTVILNKGTLGGGNSGSATNNLTIDLGATARFGTNRTDRGNGKGQIWGNAAVNGTMDLNGDGTFGANWGMNSFSGSGTIENNGSGAAQISVATANFSGALNDGTQTTALLIRNSGGSVAQLYGTSNYSGGTTVGSGSVLRVNGDAALGATSGAVTLDGSLLMNRDSNTVIDAARIINLTSNGGTLRAGWNKGLVIDGTIQGDGALTLSDDSGIVQLKGTSTYTGGTILEGNGGSTGRTRITSDASLGAASGGVTLAGGRLKNNDSVLTLNALRTVTVTGTGSRMQAGWGKNLTIEGVVQGTGDLTIDGDGGTVVWNGANTFTGNIAMLDPNGYGASHLKIGGSLGTAGNYAGNLTSARADSSFEYAGTGTQTLSGDNSAYIGTVLVTSGALLVDSAISSSTATVESGAAIGGDGSLSGDLTIEAGGKYVFDIADTLTVDGTVTLDSTFGIDDLIGISSGTPDGTYTLIANTGDFSGIENFGLGNAYILGGGKSAYFQNGSLQVVVIPEPSAIALIGLCFGALFMRRRR